RINIKSFRAVTARATFLCLCKETWREEGTPRLRARCFAPGPRSRRDFPRRHPASAENAAHPCAAPFGSCPPPPPLRRGPEGQGQQPQRQQQQQQQPHDPEGRRKPRALLLLSWERLQPRALDL